MAEESIKYEEIIDREALPKINQQLRDMVSAMDDAEDRMKKMVAASAELAKNKSFKNVDDIRAAEKAISDTAGATEALDKIEKQRQKIVKKLKELDDERVRQNIELNEQLKAKRKAIREEIKESRRLDQLDKKRIKTQEKLSDLNDERAKENALLNEQLKEKRKALRDEAKALLNQNDAYEMLKKRTNEATMKFKRLAAQYGANSREAKKARKQMEKLDDELREVNEAAKDGRRDVGRYGKAIEALKEQFPGLSKAASDAKKDIEDLNNTLQAAGAIAAFVGLMEGLQNVMGSNSKAMDNFNKAIGRISTFFEVVLGGLVKLLPEIKAIWSGFWDELVREAVGYFIEMKIIWYEMLDLNPVKDYSDKLKGLRQELAKNHADQMTYMANYGAAWEKIKGILSTFGEDWDNLIDKNDAMIDKIAAQESKLIKAKKQLALMLEYHASLEARAGAENASLEDKLALNEELLEVTRFVNQEQVKIAQAELEIAKAKAARYPDSREAQAELAEAELALSELQAENARKIEDIQKEIKQTDSDIAEQKLDFLIDELDTRKTVNERMIKDEKKVYAGRKSLLEKNRELVEDSLFRQAETINEFLEKHGQNTIDFESVYKMEKPEEIFQVGLDAGLTEQLMTRYLEHLRERNMWMQDLNEEETEFAETTRERAELEGDIILQQQTINKLKEDGVDVEKELAKLEEKRLQLEIDNLRVRILAATKNTEERLKLEQEMQDKILELTLMRLDREATAEEKARSRRIEMQQSMMMALKRLESRYAESRMDKIDEMISAEQKRGEELRELARQGVVDAEESLVENQKRQAELARQKVREERRQAMWELKLAALETYSAKVAAGDDDALASTITETAMLQAFIDSLPGFHEGTKNTGDKGFARDRHGVITGYTHQNERVMNASDNSRIPSWMSNFEVATLAQSFGRSPEALGSRVDALSVTELKKIRQAIESQPVKTSTDYDPVSRAVIDTIERKGRKERLHKKTGGIWG